MTTVASTVGAPSARTMQWSSIDWKAVQNLVPKLQVRIAKAVESGRYGRAKALQWILTHSFYAKLLAVRHVTQNKGKNTPGVDRTKDPQTENASGRIFKEAGIQTPTSQKNLYSQEKWKT